MKIGHVDLSAQVYVIAEIGGNHNGDAETAYRLVDAAAGVGVNAVKFQTYSAETLVHPSVEPVPLVKRHYATQRDRFKSLELDLEVYERIIAMCERLGLDFITTPFDLDILAQFAPRMPAIKIASGDLTYHALIRAAAAIGKPVFLSTGMATVNEIRTAAAFIPAAQRALLHCVSIYPLPDDQANILAIKTMGEAFPEAAIGYSDHTIGVEASVCAVALGARIIEKHFTLDTGQTPGDHALSLDPVGLAAMVRSIRRVEKMLGDGDKSPQPGETQMRSMMRRGLYAARDLDAGTTLTAEDVLCIRPVSSLPPDAVATLEGRRLRSALRELDPIVPDAFE
jgi:N,N'-diacetyllegionaminate synthase